MPTTIPIKTDGDEYIAMFQTWFNKTYGQPMIAVDGKYSVGTKEAYANRANDFIKAIDKENKQVVSDLTSSLNTVRKELDGLKKDSVAKNKVYAIVGAALVIGGIIGYVIKKK